MMPGAKTTTRPYSRVFFPSGCRSFGSVPCAPQVLCVRICYPTMTGLIQRGKPGVTVKDSPVRRSKAAASLL